MKRILAVVVVFLFCICTLVGQNHMPEGKYDLVSIGNETFDMLELFKMMGEEVPDSYIDFSSNGKFRLVMMGEEAEGTYKVSGNNITLIHDDEDMKAKIEGNNIIIEDSDESESGQGPMRMVFTKDRKSVV